MASDKQEVVKLQQSESLLKSILMPAFKDEACVDNHLCLNQVLSMQEDSLSDFEEDNIKTHESFSPAPEPLALTEKLFSQGTPSENNYFVSLNMIGERIRMNDTPPFYLTIISRTNSAHLILDRALDSIAAHKEYQCAFEHDLEGYAGYDFENSVSKIPLDENHIKFLRSLFEDDNSSLLCLTKLNQRFCFSMLGIKAIKL